MLGGSFLGAPMVKRRGGGAASPTRRRQSPQPRQAQPAQGVPVQNGDHQASRKRRAEETTESTAFATAFEPASWSQWVDPTKLTIILLSCPCEKAHVATRADLLPPTGVKEAECIVVPEEEMRAFCSEVLARLPHLRKLRLYGCRTWPLDWNVCHNLPRPREIRVFFRDITKPWEKEVKDLAPFMKLECFGIIESAWTIDQAVESIAFLPGLKHPSSVSKGLYGFLLTRNYGPSDDELTGDGLFKDSSKFIQYV